jgi:hypothetical protein
MPSPIGGTSNRRRSLGEGIVVPTDERKQKKVRTQKKTPSNERRT